MSIKFANRPLLLGADGWYSGELVAINGSQYVVTLTSGQGLHRNDGTSAQAGDVLSLQPDGSYQARVPGTQGPWEVCTRNVEINTLDFAQTSAPFRVAYHV